MASVTPTSVAVQAENTPIAGLAYLADTTESFSASGGATAGLMFWAVEIGAESTQDNASSITPAGGVFLFLGSTPVGLESAALGDWAGHWNVVAYASNVSPYTPFGNPLLATYHPLPLNTAVALGDTITAHFHNPGRGGGGGDPYTGPITIGPRLYVVTAVAFSPPMTLNTDDGLGFPAPSNWGQRQQRGIGLNTALVTVPPEDFAGAPDLWLTVTTAWDDTSAAYTATDGTSYLNSGTDAAAGGRVETRAIHVPAGRTTSLDLGGTFTSPVDWSMAVEMWLAEPDTGAGLHVWTRF